MAGQFKLKSTSINSGQGQDISVQSHDNSGQVRSSQVWSRAVRTGEAKSRAGQVRSEPVTLMTWSR